jgi:outer membrane cobalamin receptor
MTARRFLFAVAALIASRTTDAQVRAELRGHVTESRTARPIGGARVDVVGRSETTRSAADGSFSLDGLEPRAYTIRVRALGHVARDADVELVNGRSTSVSIELDPAPSALAAVVVRAAPGDAALNAATFDRATIEASGRRDVGELIANVPGVIITQAGGPGSESHVSMRGSGSNEVLVLVDGAPLNSPMTGEADLSRLSLTQIERIVVRTGAQSARYGGRAMAGVVEVQTRRPARDASVFARAGSWGEESGSMSVGDARPLGEFKTSALLTADYRTVRGDFDYDVPVLRGGGKARRLNVDVTSRQVAAVASMDGDAASATIRGSAETLNRGIAGSIVQPSLTGREGQRRESGGFDATWRPAALTWTFAGDVGHQRQIYGDPSPPFGSSFDDTVNATGLTGTSVISLVRRDISASLGGDARSTELTSSMLAAGAPHWQSVLGTFANVRLAHEVDSGATQIDLDMTARLDRGSLGRSTMMSPRIVGSVTSGVVVASASIGGGYSPPSLADQFFHEGVLVRPNPDLKPERVRNEVEGRVGLRELSAGPLRIAAEAAVYRADVEGMILWLPDYRFVWSPSNNDVRRSGWEMSGRAALAAVSVLGTVAHADVVYAGPVLAGQVAYRPSTTGNVTVTTGPRIAHLEVDTRYIGARRTVPGSVLNSLDPYWLTDVRLGSSWTSASWALDVTAGIENVLDRAAAMLVDYPFPSRSWTLGARIRRQDRDRGS